MQLETRQFGMLEIQDEQIIHIPKGILGFEGLEKFVLVDNPECAPFRWLQCIEAPNLAFIVVSPVIFFPEYRVAVHSKEVADIDVERPEDVEIFVIVTIPPQFEHMSANLQGPILINTKSMKAKQLVLTNSEYTVQHPVLEEVQKRTSSIVSGEVTTAQLSG